jgi:hypothetical protein
VRDELNGYAGDNVTADFDLWSRLLRRGGAVGDGRSLVSYRNHAGSIMGRENASHAKSSTEGLREILLKNSKHPNQRIHYLYYLAIKNLHKKYSDDSIDY